MTKQRTVAQKWKYRFIGLGIALFLFVLVLGIAAIRNASIQQNDLEVKRDGIQTVGTACGVNVTPMRRSSDKLNMRYCYEVDGKEYVVTNWVETKHSRSAAEIEIRNEQEIIVYYLEANPNKATVGDYVY